MLLCFFFLFVLCDLSILIPSWHSVTFIYRYSERKQVQYKITWKWGKVWVNWVDDVWLREGVGQLSRRCLTEGRCGSTESTMFDWGKVCFNRVDDVWLRDGVGQPGRRRFTEGRCGSTESTTFDWGKVWVNRVDDVWLREGVGQPGRRRLTWGKVGVNRVDDVWLTLKKYRELERTNI